MASCASTTTAEKIDLMDAARDALLDVRSAGCGPRIGFGTATLIDDTLALTAAHVVAGAESVSVIDLDGNEHEAQAVWFDADLDLAALLVPEGIGTPVALASEEAGDPDHGMMAVSRGVFDDRVVTVERVDIPRHVDVATTDIYLDRDVIRPGFEVTGAIEPGDSGSMVVTADGAIGVVWSRSNAANARAWAVDVTAEFSDPAFLRSLGADVDVGPCIR